jgi:hypothetical protein
VTLTTILTIRLTAITVVISAILALNVPDNFDPDANMLTNESGLHSVRDTIKHAARLVSQGGREDLELAGKMIDAVIQCQERRPDDANFGNFLWYQENEVVEDLNGVSFTLSTMIPMMIRYGDRLPLDLHQRVLESIRLGLNATARLDVSPGYTNIAVFDVVNTCLGGELLQDPVFIARGRLKLALWMLFTAKYGIPFEYNSPTYTGVAIDALGGLAKYSKDRDTRIRARTSLARIGLSVALHVHPSTGCWAGPHSRAYHGGLASRGDNRVNQWVNGGVLPSWTIDVMRRRPEKMQVVETAFPDFSMGLTTYHSPSFALGVSANEGLGGQGNSLIAQYRRPGKNDPGVLYSRYLVNDKWMGTFVHPTDRKVTRDLIQEGKFFGVQQGERAIGIYTPAALEYTTSAKATLIWTDRKSIDEILINHERINQLPAEISPGDTVVVCSGDAMTAVRPLKCTDLGRESPMQLTQIGDDLVLEMYNYRGPKKVFWGLQWPGGFFQGMPQSGFYLEMAERSDYRSAAEFSAVVAGGKLTDVTAAPFTYSGTGERLWTIEYSRAGKSLGIEADLMKWKLKRRWNEQGEIGWPMLESPVAGETRTGQVEIGDARLRCGKEAGWLFASPESKRWVAGYVGLTPAPLALKVPGGKVEIDAMTVGTVCWDNGNVTVDAIGIKGIPRVTGGNLIGNSIP